jgi:hypothetical protein
LEVLAARLGDAVRADEDGWRVVTSERAKAFRDELAAARQRERERQAQLAADIAAKGNPTRDRVRRLQAAQDRFALVDNGEPLDPRQALAAMKLVAGDHDRQLDAAATSRQELLSGATVYHSVKD